jgi:hypothetical protein
MTTLINRRLEQGRSSGSSASIKPSLYLFFAIILYLLSIILYLFAIILYSC